MLTQQKTCPFLSPLIRVLIGCDLPEILTNTNARYRRVSTRLGFYWVKSCEMFSLRFLRFQHTTIVTYTQVDFVCYCLSLFSVVFCSLSLKDFNI